MRKLWGGVFGEGDGEAFAVAFGESLASDLTFFAEDVRGSMAHARMLASVGILSQEEGDLLLAGLGQILEEGPERLPHDVEDIHTAVEVRLGELVGDVAGKLHTARSRNDQVATDARLWIRGQLPVLEAGIKALQSGLLEQAKKHSDTLMPGVTHQQHGQPITLGFHFLALFFAFQRHGHRLGWVGESTGGCPLGSAALAGTPFGIDRAMTAAELGFDAPTSNALDGTSDRSFILDFLHVSNLLMLDLSRMAQEFVLWTTPEFGYVRLPDELTTGSSIMPQKRNPDIAELIRGRSGVPLGAYSQLSMMMKGLVLGYNRDTQEDKPAMFQAHRMTLACLEGMSRMVVAAEFRPERMRAAIHSDFSTATDLADALAAKGVPFREAHEIAGKAVRFCLEAGIGLEDLSLEQLKGFSELADESTVSALTPESSRARRESQGGTGPAAVQEQILLARSLLDEQGFTRLWS